MEVLKCDECGCHVPLEKVFERIERMRKEEMLSQGEAEKAKENVKQGVPFVRCHAPECSGFLQPIDENQVQVDLSRYTAEGDPDKKINEENG